MDLERAAASLRKSDYANALEALLAAWKEKRSARIADAIDRVAARLPHEPVTGKTVKARTVAWLALAKKRKPIDLGPLLATPWPGKWQEAVPVLDALLKFPPDPRLAMALTRVVEATPYDSYQTYRFYVPLVYHLGKLLDRRTLPVLEKDLQRRKSRGWREDVQPSLAKAVAKIAAAEEGALTKKEEAALASVEAFFAADATNERAKAKGEAEFLAAIYAAPDDDSLRMVFADWLQERGDPRGELIALQLERHAGRSTPATLQREASLIKKHGAAWAGPLHPFLEKEDRVFERGFLARGTLVLEGRPKSLPRDLDQPAWATVHTLTLDWYVNRDDLGTEVLALPSLQHLRGIGGCFEAVAEALPVRPLVQDLEVELLPMRDESPELLEARKRFAEGKSLPALKRLGIDGQLDRLPLLLDGALGKRLECITLFNTDLPLGPFVRMLDKLELKPAEARAVYRLRSDDDVWRLTMRRDAEGRLTVLHGFAHRAERGTGGARQLADALETLDPHELTAITIDRSVPCRYDEDDIERIEKQLARFTNLGAIDVPWDRIASASAISVKANARPLATYLYGKTIPKRLAEVWEIVQEPPVSLVLDSYSVNHGAHKPLPSLAEAERVLALKRTTRLSLYAKGNSDVSKLDVIGGRLEISSALAPEDSTAFLNWLFRTCDRLGIEGGHVCFGEMGEDGWEARPYLTFIPPLNDSLAWVLFLPPELDSKIPFAELEKLARKKEHRWLRTVRTKTTLALIFGETPTDIPPRERVDAFQAAVENLKR